MNIRKSRLVFIFIALTFKAILDFSYINFISTLFGYVGFQLSENIVKYIEGWIIFTLLACMVPDRLKRPSDFLFFLLFTITISPMISFYGLANKDRLYLYFVILIFIIIWAVRLGPRIKIPYIKHGTSIAVFICLLMIGLALVKFATSGALGKIDFNLSKVYEHREEVGETLGIGIWGYIIPWVTKMFTLTIFALALLKKKFYLAGLLLIFQIFLFGITSHKAVALYPIYALTLYILKDIKYIITYCMALITGLLGVCLMTYYLWKDVILSSLFIRRFFFVPALNNFNYYDFFSHHQHVYLSHGILSSLIEYPYDLLPAHLIGSVYYGAPEMAANTGFVATSYMNFGFPGMIIFGLFVAILLKLVDSFSIGDKPTWFYLAILTVPFTTVFKSSELLTTLLTHGLIVAIILAWLTYGIPESLKKQPNQR